MNRIYTLVLVIVGFASNAFCDLSGTWVRDFDGVTMELSQNGDQLSGQLPTPIVDHQINGTCDSNGICSIKVKRVTKASGGVAMMYGRLEVKGDWHFRMIITTTDGGEGLPKTYPGPGEVYTWSKVNTNIVQEGGGATLVLGNKHWDQVKVEIRVGNDTQIVRNPWYVNRIHQFGKDSGFTIKTDGKDVYFRREANPDSPDGRMSEWTRVPLSNGQHKDLDIK